MEDLQDKPTPTTPATKNRLLVIFNSNPHLGDTVVTAKLNLGLNELKLTMSDTDDFRVLDWLIQVPEDETITLMLTDKDKHVCQVVLSELYLSDHECALSQDRSAFGIDADDDTWHEITVFFQKVERIKNFRL